MRVGILLFTMVALLATCVELRAHETYVSPVQTNDTIINSTSTKGIALAISMSQIDFTHSSQKWQAGAGVGFYKDTTAISGAVAKRFKNTLVKFSMGVEEGDYAAGVGFVFQLN